MNSLSKIKDPDVIYFWNFLKCPELLFQSASTVEGNSDGSARAEASALEQISMGKDKERDYYEKYAIEKAHEKVHSTRSNTNISTALCQHSIRTGNSCTVPF